MVDAKRTGRFIALCRKARGFTQEQLAAALGVSGQAVSKWENAQALPDTALLPSLAAALRTSVDRLLTPGDLHVLWARLTDGDVDIDVTDELNAIAGPNTLEITRVSATLEKRLHPHRFLYLVMRFAFAEAEGWAFASQDGTLLIDSEHRGTPLPAQGYALLDARYGNAAASSVATGRINHMLVFGYEKYSVSHQTFDSPPNAVGEERLALLFANACGIHALCVPEGWRYAVGPQGFSKLPPANAGRKFVENVPALAFGRGMDCTWAGAMTCALNALGHNTDYADVMGASGACYRINFLHPMWDYSSVDGLIVYSHDLPLFAAYGHEMVLGDPSKEGREDERSRIIRDLDRGKPTVCINLRVAHEWGLVTGYTGEGQNAKLWCRSYFDELADPLPQGLPPEEYYRPVENWPFIIMHFGAARSPKSARETLISSFETFAACSLEEKLSRGYASGFRAYEVWRDALRDEEAFSSLTDEVFCRRMDVNQFCMLALTDARRAARAYLSRGAGLVEGDLREAAASMAECFAEVCNAIDPIFDALPADCPQLLKGRVPREAWPRELRQAQADAFDFCIACERAALGFAQAALKKRLNK